MKSVFIGLGSNLANPVQQLLQALQSLKKLDSSNYLRASSFYKSKPWGPYQNQPDFVNTVVQLETSLSPLELLKELKAIENQQGRMITERWGPRCIDLDILLYGSDEFALNEVIIPHPRLGERDFVIYPLLELAADLVLPNGLSLRELSEQCPNQLERLLEVEL